MKKFFPYTVAFVCFITIAALGQDIRPTPTPTASDDVVKISTNLIQIDVTVLDAKGNPVTDLRPDEIEIYENGQKQTMTNLSFVSARPPSTEMSKEAKKAALRIPGIQLRADQVRRTFALVVDDLSLSFETAFKTRTVLRKFVNEQMQDGDLVAIIRTGAGMGALQQFTSDRRMLHAAIDKVKWNPLGTGGISTFGPVRPTMSEDLKAAGLTSTDADIADEKNRGNRNDDFRSTVFMTGTLGALKYVVSGMDELPGRKSVILFSDGFRLYERDDKGNRHSNSAILEGIRALTETANRASVVIYSIDPRGLEAPFLSAEDSVADPMGGDVDKYTDDRREQLASTQDGLKFLAEQTGGFAITNNNDLLGGVRKVLRDQSYYLVGYEPKGETFDPKTRRFNKLDVKVLRPGVSVRYRSGFFGIANENRVKPATTPEQTMLRALTSPFSLNEISLRLNAMFAADEQKSAYIKAFLHVEAGELTFERQPDGQYKTNFDLVAVTFGESGAVADEYAKAYTMTVKEDVYKRIVKNGFVYKVAFPVKKSGGYQVRIALRDAAKNKIGSANQFIQVPNVRKNRPVMSGVVFENFEPDQWARINKDIAVYEEIRKDSDPLRATALRQFKRGNIVRWGVTLYNTRLGKQPTRQIKLYRDGKLVMEGPVSPVSQDHQNAEGGVDLTGILQLGNSLEAGDYVVEIIFGDAAKQKRIATQYAQFEIVE